MVYLQRTMFWGSVFWIMWFLTQKYKYRCIRVYVWFKDDKHVIWMWIWLILKNISLLARIWSLLTRHQTSYSGSAGRYFRYQSIHIQITYTSLSISNLQVKAPFILTFPHRLCVNMDAPVFVITIKLGTKTCGFAFQSRYDFKHNPTMAMSYVFKADSTPSKEFPTSLFLARNGDVSFGYEAQHIFTDSRGEGVYFGNFGENLYLSEVCYFHPKN